MKVQAKDIKTGDTVKYANVWVHAEEVIHGTFKNGKKKVTVVGTQLAGTVRRSNGSKNKIREIKDYKVEFRSETKVSVK